MCRLGIFVGISSLGGNRTEELAMHPTVKPVALVPDAIRDCSRRGETVLDLFGGSGSTFIAAESCGRRARLLEFDPLYCDTIVSRWQRFTGKAATHEGDGRSFKDVALRRGVMPAVPEGAIRPRRSSARIPGQRQTGSL